MSFSLQAESPLGTPFATPSHHHNPSAGNTPFISNHFPSSSPNNDSNLFGQQNGASSAQNWSSGAFATPLQPNRTSNVPMFHYPGQDPFSAPAGPNAGATPFHPKSPFSLQQSSPPSPPKPSLQPSGQSQKPKGYRYRSYNRSNENSYQPINSSPLAQQPPKLLDDDMDDEDTAFDSNIPSSPLGRVPNSSSTVTAGSSSCAPGSVFKFGSAPSRRFPKTPGDDDDFDDVNPSPLLARRRAQYKSTGPLRRSLPHPSTRGRLSLDTNVSASRSLPSFSSPTSSPPVASLFSTRPETEENPRTAFLKDRFKKRYFARATKAREKAVRERRKRIEGMENLLDPDSEDEVAKARRRAKAKGKGRCSDDDMESDEEDEDDALNDPLLGRFMALINRKEQHAYRQSYAREVGSSFDPDMEDVTRWEEEFTAAPAVSSREIFLQGTPGRQRDFGSSPPRAPTEYEFDGDLDDEVAFADVEDEEVEAYAEEYARAVEQQEFEEYQRQVQEQEVEYQEALGQNQGQGAQQGRREVYDDTLEGLENLPEDELFGEWNWSESDGEKGGKGEDEMDLS